LIFEVKIIVACYIHIIIFVLSFYIQQVYGDRGAKIKGKLLYLILIIIFKLFVYFIKMGREFCSSLHTFSFTK
jgi:hypothetical protein